MTQAARTLLGLFGTSLVLSACGQATLGTVGGMSAESPPPVASPIFHEPDWGNPIDGVAAPSLQDAASATAFALVLPSSLGDPTAVFTDVPVEQGSVWVVALLYETERYGSVAVIENPPDMPVADYDASNRAIVAEVAANAAEGRAFGIAEIVALPNGEQALVTTSPDGTRSSIAWLENETEIIVRGQDLQREQAIEIASEF